MSGQAAVANLNTQAAASGVLAKLLVFTTLLGAFPISSYFLSLKYLWNGNPTFAAITAVVAANIVLVGYIIASVLEDNQSSRKPTKEKEESKKDR